MTNKLFDDDVRKVLTNRVVGTILAETLNTNIVIEWKYDTDETTKKHYIQLILTALKYKYSLLYAELINLFNIDESNYQMSINNEYKFLMKIKNKSQIIPDTIEKKISIQIANEVKQLINIYANLQTT